MIIDEGDRVLIDFRFAVSTDLVVVFAGDLGFDSLIRDSVSDDSTSSV